MKILHTADWHVGRRARSNSRAGEHQAVLAEIVSIAADREVDMIIVAGDQFDRAAPGPSDERLVWATLTQLAQIAPTVTIAGNHDHPSRLDAVSDLLGSVGVTALGRDVAVGDGGQVRLTTRKGEDATIALLPWVSQRRAVTSDVMVDDADTAGAHGSVYAEYMRGLTRDLCEGMTSDTVNLLVGHMTVLGSIPSGGERKAHTTIEYHVPPTSFPPILDYVALGHLHRCQFAQRTGPPIAYPGSPLSLDFAETGGRKVLLIDVEADRTPDVEEVGLTAGWPMTTVDCIAEDMAEQIGSLPGNAWVRVRLSGPVPAGIADQARTMLGDRLLAVQIARPDLPSDALGAGGTRRSARPAPELFAEYATTQGIEDDDVTEAFTSLYTAITDAQTEPTDATA